MPDTMQKTRELTTKENVKIYGLYFFLFCGGLWHVLDVLQPIMRATAAPVMIALTIWVFVETLQKSIEKKRQFFIWSIIVVTGSFAIEGIGVKTGIIFGGYSYGETLQPQISDVPIAIGFAWLIMLLGSFAIWQRLGKHILGKNVFINAAGVALIMTLFDVFMEPAAIKLDYWQWEGGDIPLQNYAAWFCISYVFALIAEQWKLFENKLPQLNLHAYFAQLLYFIMVGF